MIVNKRFWEGLPAEIRATLEQAMREATAFERRIAEQANDDALLAVHKVSEPSIGRDLIQAVYKVAADVEREKATPPGEPEVKTRSGQSRLWR